MPTDVEINNLLTLFQSQQFDEAEKLAIALSERFPKHPFAWQMLGVVLKQTGRIRESLVPLEKSVYLAPQDPGAHNNLGVTLQKLGKLKEAEASYIKAIELQSNFVEAYLNLGITLKGLGKLANAETRWREALIFRPDYVEAHYNLGIMFNELGRLQEAEASYNRVIALRPSYAEAHYNLGITLRKLNRLEEAEASYARAINLNSDYAEAHFHLGGILRELGRLEEAVASYTQAIALKSEFAEASNNLGVTLTELERIDDAEASLRQAIALKPDSAEAHYNLGNTLTKLGRLKDAEASYRQAVALKPDYAEAQSNLGNTLRELGRLDEAEASYTQAIELKPGFAEALINLSTLKSYMNNLEAEIISLQSVMQIDADNYGLRAGVNLALCKFLLDDFEGSKKHLLSVATIQNKTSSEFKNGKIYHTYLLKILSWHEGKYFDAFTRKPDKTLYVIGDSHSLVSHQINVKNSTSIMSCKAKLIKGCKQWHLGNPNKNQYKNQFESIFSSILKSSLVLLTFGEIDCRLDSGIIRHKNKFPEKKIEEIIADTIENFLSYVTKNNWDYYHTVFIQGVPCPNIDTRAYLEKDVTQLIEVIRKFNYELENKSRKKGFEFLDVHKLTDRGDGFSNGVWHIDGYHLSPKGMEEVWQRHAPEKPL